MAYIGVNNKARKVTDAYVGFNGKARKVKKAYIGVDGVARLWMDNTEPVVEPEEVVYPMLVANRSWYKGSVAQKDITSITLVDSYEPTGSEDESWAADVDGTGAITCYLTGTDLVIAGNGSGKISANPSSYTAFCMSSNSYVTNSACAAINNLDLLDTSKVTDMSSMFAGCNSLTQLDVSDFDTSNVINMNSMFHSCSSLWYLNIWGFDTSKVQNMGSMFWGCSKLSEIEGTVNFDTSNVTNTASMFRDCSSLTNLNLSSFDTKNVTRSFSMFENCSKLTLIYADKDVWDLSNADRTDMFKNCGTSAVRLKTVPTLKADWWPEGYDKSKVNQIMIYGHDAPRPTTTMIAIDEGGEGNIMVCNNNNLEGSIYIYGNGTYIKAPIKFNYAFADFPNLGAILVSGLDMSEVREMRGTFMNTHVDNWTGNSLSAVGDWHLPRVVDLQDCFNGFSSDEAIDLTIWDCNVGFNNGSCDRIFANAHIPSLKLPGMYLGQGAFHNCVIDSQELDLSDCKPGSADLSYMFANCNVKNLILGKEFRPDWRKTNDENGFVLDHMFDGCSNITYLDLTSWNLGGDQSCEYMFANCPALNEVLVIDTSWGEGSAQEGVCENSGITDVTRLPAAPILGYPMLAPGQSWYKGERNVVFTKVAIYDTSNIGASWKDYEEIGEKTWDKNAAQYETVKITCDHWPADVDRAGEIMCYRKVWEIEIDKLVQGPDDDVPQREISTHRYGTLTIVGNGSGKIFAHPNSHGAFANLSFYDSTAYEEAGSALTVFTGLNLLDTSQVITMSAMFDGNRYVGPTLDLDGWDTRNVVNMSYLFRGCVYLNTLNISSFNTSNVVNMEQMFRQVGYNTLELDLSHFDTSKVTNMSAMFEHTTAALDISSFDTRNVTDISRMFHGCHNNRGDSSIDLTHFNIDHITNFSEVFQNVGTWNPGVYVDIRTWDFRRARDITNMMNRDYDNTYNNVFYVNQKLFDIPDDAVGSLGANQTIVYV